MQSKSSLWYPFQIVLLKGTTHNKITVVKLALSDFFSIGKQTFVGGGGGVVEYHHTLPFWYVICDPHVLLLYGSNPLEFGWSSNEDLESVVVSCWTSSKALNSHTIWGIAISYPLIRTITKWLPENYFSGLWGDLVGERRTCSINCSSKT